MKAYEILTNDDLPGEIWVDVVGLEKQYQVSNQGRMRVIYNSATTLWRHGKPKVRILKQRLCNGYCRCKLGLIHRFVARAFVEGYSPELFVNHLNGIRDDNSPGNLEWCTPKRNAEHAWETGLCGNLTRKRMSEKAKLRTGVKNNCWKGFVDIFNSEGIHQTTVNTLEEAALWIKNHTKYKKADKGNISLVCNGKLKKMYGHSFRYRKPLK